MRLTTEQKQQRSEGRQKRSDHHSKVLRKLASAIDNRKIRVLSFAYSGHTHSLELEWEMRKKKKRVTTTRGVRAVGRVGIKEA